MDDTVLRGVETRASSPLRTSRGKDFLSLNLRGLYPAGHGAGYAGGITSAGVDGIEVGEAVGRGMVGFAWRLRRRRRSTRFGVDRREDDNAAAMNATRQ